MTSFNETDINRDRTGKFAPKTTSETDVSALGSNVRVEYETPQGASYVEDLDDGGMRRFALDADDPAKQYSVYYDANRQYHRDNGPAWVDPGYVSWYQHGQTHRDPNEGPAWISEDGHCGYMLNGRTVDAPDAATRKAQGVIGYVRYGKQHYCLEGSSADFESSNGELREDDPQPGQLEQLEALEPYFYDGRDEA